jgi:hypothetical protein
MGSDQEGDASLAKTNGARIVLTHSLLLPLRLIPDHPCQRLINDLAFDRTSGDAEQQQEYDGQHCHDQKTYPVSLDGVHLINLMELD